jgi:hypothetical protein
MPALSKDFRTKFEPSRQYAIVHPRTGFVLTHKHNTPATFAPWTAHDTQIFEGPPTDDSSSDHNLLPHQTVLLRAAAAPNDGLGLLGHGKIGFISARPGVYLDIQSGSRDMLKIFLCDDTVRILLRVSPSLEVVEFPGEDGWGDNWDSQGVISRTIFTWRAIRDQNRFWGNFLDDEMEFEEENWMDRTGRI